MIVLVTVGSTVMLEQPEQAEDKVIFCVAVVVVGIGRSIQMVVRERWCGSGVVGQVDRERVRFP